MNKEKDGSNFLQGAFILTIAGLIVKILGAIYRFPLARILGAEGIGLYQMAYPIYVTLLAISTAGLPTAISKMVAEKRALGRYRDAFRVFKVSFMILAVIGFVFTVVLFFLAEFLAFNVIKNPGALYPILSIAPAIFFVSIMSSFRGFFQGRQYMIPSAISQVLEQVGRVITVFVLVILLLPKGIEYGAAGAAFGPVLGGLAGLLILVVIYLRAKKEIISEIASDRTGKLEEVPSIIKRLFKFAIPITIGGLIIPIMSMADLAIVSRKLQEAGFTIERSGELYGQLTGMAAPLVNLPPIITIALAAALVPSISEAIAKNQIKTVKYRSSAGIRITVIAALPSAIGLFVLATPICKMLYNNPEAGIPLSVMSFGVIFLCMNQLTAGILQGIGRTGIPVRNIFMGAIVKILLNYSLTGIPEINIKGAALATVSAYFVSSSLNLLAIKKLIGIEWNFKNMLLIPLFSTIIMGVVVKLTYNQMYIFIGSNTLSTLSAIIIGGLVYSLLMAKLGGINERDLLMIPVAGEKAVKLLKRFKLLRGQ